MEPGSRPDDFMRRILTAARPRGLNAALAVAGFVAIPTLLRLVIDNVVTGTTFITYLPFVIISALCLDWRWTSVVVLFSAIAANYFFMSPRHILFARTGDTFGALLFVLACALAIVIVETLRATIVKYAAATEREGQLNRRLEHLNAELQHRVKNTLAVAQALARQTFRDSDRAAVTIFMGRMRALADAQAVLRIGGWEVCELPELVVDAIKPFGGSARIRVGGANCTLPERACVPLMLALHELGTNAVKYGALSTAAGHVSIHWAVQRDGGGSELVLTWTERGGPTVVKPTHRGFGSRLLRAQRGLDAVALDFQADGIVCRIVVKDARGEMTPENVAVAPGGVESTSLIR